MALITEYNSYELQLKAIDKARKQVGTTLVRPFYGRSHAPIANQYIIESFKGATFQSYNSIIAHIDFESGQVFLDSTYWNYSRTTSKYLHAFLHKYCLAPVKSAKQGVKDGDYILTDLSW